MPGEIPSVDAALAAIRRAMGETQGMNIPSWREKLPTESLAPRYEMAPLPSGDDGWGTIIAGPNDRGVSHRAYEVSTTYRIFSWSRIGLSKSSGKRQEASGRAARREGGTQEGSRLAEPRARGSGAPTQDPIECAGQRRMSRRLHSSTVAYLDVALSRAVRSASANFTSS